MGGYPPCRVLSQPFSSLYCNNDFTGEAPGRVSSLLKRTNLFTRAARQVRVLQFTFLAFSSPVPLKEATNNELREKAVYGHPADDFE